MITLHFCDTCILPTFVIHSIFFISVLQDDVLCSNEGKSTQRVLFGMKSFEFFREWTIILGNFENYLSLLRSPEFVFLSVSKDADHASAITRPAEHSTQESN